MKFILNEIIKNRRFKLEIIFLEEFAVGADKGHIRIYFFFVIFKL